MLYTLYLPYLSGGGDSRYTRWYKLSFFSFPKLSFADE